MKKITATINISTSIDDEETVGAVEELLTNYASEQLAQDLGQMYSLPYDPRMQANIEVVAED